jgi:hypothetical protein
MLELAIATETVHDVENWKEPAVGIRSKDTQETLSWHHALASSMVMPLWLGSSLRPEHAISEDWVKEPW